MNDSQRSISQAADHPIKAKARRRPRVESPATFRARQQRKHDTMLTIGSAALRVALSQGVHNVTVDQIALEANVSARTVFNYFGTREQAILDIDVDRPRRAAARLLERPASESPLRALVEVSIERRAGPLAFRQRAELVRQEPVLHAAYAASLVATEDALTEAMAVRLNRPVQADPLPRLLVAVGTSAFRVTVNHLVEHASMDELAQDRMIKLIHERMRQTVALLEHDGLGPPVLFS